MTLTITGRTDRQTDGQTDRVRRNMQPPPREEGRIIIDQITGRNSKYLRFIFFIHGSVQILKCPIISKIRILLLAMIEFLIFLSENKTERIATRFARCAVKRD